MQEPVIVNEFEIHVEQQQDFQFLVRFDKTQFAPLTLDEPPPLGSDAGPNAARMLAAAVGNCLSASLLLCVRKAHAGIGPIRTTVKTQMARNEKGRVRISRIDVHIDPQIPAEDQDKAARCRALFEDYCVVTQSVREGIDVHVTVA